MNINKVNSKASRIFVTIAVLLLLSYAIFSTFKNFQLRTPLFGIENQVKKELFFESIQLEKLLPGNALQSSNPRLTTYDQKVSEKRNKWIWVGLSVGGAVIAAAAGLAPLWAPVFVVGMFGKIIISLLTAARTATTAVGAVGAVQWSKRGINDPVNMHGIFLMNDVRNNSLYYYNVLHVHGDEIHQKLKGFNNSKYQAFTINSTGANSQGALIAKSLIGNHTFVTGPTYDIGRLVIDIAEQQSSNCYGECYLALKYGLSNDTSSSLKKKTQYYDVNWSSYNYDVWSTQYEPELRYPGTSWGDVEDQVNAGYANNGDPDTWKYCMCVDGDTSGQYDDMTDNRGLAGEVYFNTYGGVDGYCDDLHCGAQTGRMYLSHQNKLREYMKTDYFLQTKKAKRFS